MKTMKKVISALLLVCVLASFMTVGAYADNPHVTDVTLTAESSDGANAGPGSNISIDAVVGETVTVTAEVHYEDDCSDKVNWTDPATANLVSATDYEHSYTFPSAGTYVVSVVTKANDNNGNKLTAKCTINVSAAASAPVAPETISIASVSGNTSILVNNTLKLKATVSNASIGYWEIHSGDGYGTFDVVSGNETVTFTGTKAGTVNIVAHTKTGTISNVLTVYVNAPRTLVIGGAESMQAGQEVWFYVSGADSSEIFTWSYSTSPSGVSIITKSTNSSANTFGLTAGKGSGYVTITATSAHGESGSIQVPVNSVGYGDAVLSPTTVSWTKGQGNLTFTVEPTLFSAYIDGVCITGSGNNSKYNYVWSSKNLIINSSYLSTLSAGNHVLTVNTVYADGTNAGTQYATITINGTASAVYGDNAHVRGTANNLYFNSNSAIKSVTISGTTIDPANYTLSNDGKSITLKANFLNLLNYGTYTMKLSNANGGTETATFRIVTANYAPATGDESNLAIWVAVMIISGVGAIALIPKRKKEM